MIKARRGDFDGLVSVTRETHRRPGRSEKISKTTQEAASKSRRITKANIQLLFVLRFPFLPFLAIAGLLYPTFYFFSIKLNHIHRRERRERRE
jgi:hypothetical protein